VSQFVDNWLHGSAYERYVGRWSRQIAPLFLDWLNLPAGQRWLDVGCGTGAVSAAVLDCCAPAAVLGLDPTEGFLTAAQQNLGGQASLCRGSAAAIPLRAGAVDAVVSGLALNFVPDQPAAAAEMRRVLRRGGSAGLYVWDYAGKMDFMRYFWDAANELFPESESMDEGRRFPICRPEALETLFRAAGFQRVETTGIEIPTPFLSFSEYWEPFLGRTGAAPAYVASLRPDDRQRLREALQERIPAHPDGSISMTARAWAVRGEAA
jgi:SAM-dependent methyltransferase